MIALSNASASGTATTSTPNETTNVGTFTRARHRLASTTTSAAPEESASTAPSATPSAAPTDRGNQPTDQPTDRPAHQPSDSQPTKPTDEPADRANRPATPSAAPVDPNAFNEKVARQKLDTYAGVIDGACHDAAGVTGPGVVARDLRVRTARSSQVSVDPPYANTKQGTCAIGFLKRAAAPAFVGAPVTIAYKFSVAK